MDSNENPYAPPREPSVPPRESEGSDVVDLLVLLAMVATAVALFAICAWIVEW